MSEPKESPDPAAGGPPEAAGVSEADRRNWPRIPAEALPNLSAKLATGPDIRLVDLSRGGARFECEKRLLPGAKVALRLVTPDGTLVVRGRVVRSRIVRLERGGLGYDAAIAFNETLNEVLEEPGAGGQPAEAGEAVADPAGEGETVEARDRDDEAPEVPLESWVPPVELMTVTATVPQTSEELREIFDGNDW
jgi:hypothetical protein